MLNEMARTRPSAPYGWLARRMRRDDWGHSPAVGTVPVLSDAAKSMIGSAHEKQWGFVLGLQGQAPSGGAAARPAAATAAATNVLLTIDPLGDGVMLAIRPGK